MEETEERFLEGDEWEALCQKQTIVLSEEGNPIGSLQYVADVWEQYGCSSKVLEWMRTGVPIAMPKGKPRSKGGRKNYVKKEAMAFANEEVSRLYFVQAVVLDLSPEDEGYTFPLGAVRKKGAAKFRLITDLTDKGNGPNAFMEKMSFKLEHVDDLLTQIGRNWYGLVFDLRAGFHHLLVRNEDQKWLRFKWAGIPLKFRAMPFGPRHSPYYFCKTMREFVKILRRGCTVKDCNHKECMFRAAPNGVTVISYVDDFCLAAETKEQLLRIREEILVPLMTELGLIRALNKGAWEPSQVFDFLGFELNTIIGHVRIPGEKVDLYSKALEAILKKGVTTPKELASVAGKIVSVMRAFAPALIYMRSTFETIAGYVDGAKGWWSEVVLTDEVREDLMWLRENLAARNGRFMWRPARLITLTTDAASRDKGWGATLWVDGVMYKAHGRWNKQQQQLDISELEMLGILYGVQSFRDQIRGRNLQIVTDNMVCKHTLPTGSRVKQLRKLVKQIHDEVCNLDATIVDVLWIPSELNVIPDYLSRYKDVNDWMLRETRWNMVKCLWPALDYDRFSNGDDQKLPKFNTRWASPEMSAEFTNALAQKWTGTFSYACPPMAMIGRVLQLIKEQKARAVLICPVWPASPWYPLLRSMTVKEVALGNGYEAFQAGPSGQCSPHKNPNWMFLAVEVNGNKCQT